MTLDLRRHLAKGIRIDNAVDLCIHTIIPVVIDQWSIGKAFRSSPILQFRCDERHGPR
jgi:hypothetical protein